MAEKSLINSNLESQLENGSRQCVYSLGEDLKLQSVPAYNPRPDIIISLHAHKCSSGFTLVFYNAVYLVSQKDFISWLVGQTSRVSRTPKSTPFLSKKLVPDLLLLRAGTEFDSVQVGQKLSQGLRSPPEAWRLPPFKFP